jgi:hypothetical protein
MALLRFKSPAFFNEFIELSLGNQTLTLFWCLTIRQAVIAESTIIRLNPETVGIFVLIEKENLPMITHDAAVSFVHVTPPFLGTRPN